MAQDERLTYSVEQVGRLLGLSRNAAFEGVRKGAIPSIRVGKRILVPKAALERLLAKAEAQEEGR